MPSEKVTEIFAELLKDDSLMEDRREYTQDQLQEMYGLTDVEAGDLQFLIKGVFDPTDAPIILDNSKD